MSVFFDHAGTPWTELGDGIRRKIVGHTPDLMSVLVQFDKGAVGTPHAHEVMRMHRIRHLPVLQGGKLVGIISERDIVSRVVAKRRVGAGAIGQSAFSRGEAVPADWRIDQPTMIQPFLPAIQHEGELSFIFIDGAFSHALIKHTDFGKASFTASELAQRIKAADPENVLKVLGPAPAPLSRLKGEHRLQVLIKTRYRRQAREALDAAMLGLKEAQQDLKMITIEVDPVNLM